MTRKTCDTTVFLTLHTLSSCLAAVTRTQTSQRDRPAESLPVPQRPEGLAPLRLRRTRPVGESVIPVCFRAKVHQFVFYSGVLELR